MEKDVSHKKPMPKEFIPTELGSAVFASVDGAPTDEEFLILNNNSQDDIKNGAGDKGEKSKQSQ
ncbi:MAG: hypothetical protein CVU89_12720 [Firmicutes bacterium HGW-Firmicutes-14]|jgi:hypothetical protein|nr:MAG: hypothetical protein CVU89_12720 [Firmicutes bacterium HGW-Firmicutes-14]